MFEAPLKWNNYKTELMVQNKVLQILSNLRSMSVLQHKYCSLKTKYFVTKEKGFDSYEISKNVVA